MAIMARLAEQLTASPETADGPAASDSNRADGDTVAEMADTSTPYTAPRTGRSAARRPTTPSELSGTGASHVPWRETLRQSETPEQRRRWDSSPLRSDPNQPPYPQRSLSPSSHGLLFPGGGGGSGARTMPSKRPTMEEEGTTVRYTRIPRRQAMPCSPLQRRVSMSSHADPLRRRLHDPRPVVSAATSALSPLPTGGMITLFVPLDAPAPAAEPTAQQAAMAAVADAATTMDGSQEDPVSVEALVDLRDAEHARRLPAPPQQAPPVLAEPHEIPMVDEGSAHWPPLEAADDDEVAAPPPQKTTLLRERSPTATADDGGQSTVWASPSPQMMRLQRSTEEHAATPSSAVAALQNVVDVASTTLQWMHLTQAAAAALSGGGSGSSSAMMPLGSVTSVPAHRLPAAPSPTPLAATHQHQPVLSPPEKPTSSSPIVMRAFPPSPLASSSPAASASFSPPPPAVSSPSPPSQAPSPPPVSASPASPASHPPTSPLSLQSPTTHPIMPSAVPPPLVESLNLVPLSPPVAPYVATTPAFQSMPAMRYVESMRCMDDIDETVSVYDITMAPSSHQLHVAALASPSPLSSPSSSSSRPIHSQPVADPSLQEEKAADETPISTPTSPLRSPPSPETTSKWPTHSTDSQSHQAVAACARSSSPLHSPRSPAPLESAAPPQPVAATTRTFAQSSPHGHRPSPPPLCMPTPPPLGLVEADEREAHWLPLVTCSESDDDWAWLPLKGTPSSSDAVSDNEHSSSVSKEAERCPLMPWWNQDSEEPPEPPAPPPIEPEGDSQTAAMEVDPVVALGGSYSSASSVPFIAHVDARSPPASAPSTGAEENGHEEEDHGEERADGADASAHDHRAAGDGRGVLSDDEATAAEPELDAFDFQSSVLSQVFSEMQLAVSNVVNRTGEAVGTPSFSSIAPPPPPPAPSKQACTADAGTGSSSPSRCLDPPGFRDATTSVPSSPVWPTRERRASPDAEHGVPKPAVSNIDIDGDRVTTTEEEALRQLIDMDDEQCRFAAVAAESAYSVDNSDAYVKQLRASLASFPAMSYWQGVADGQGLVGAARCESEPIDPVLAGARELLGLAAQGQTTFQTVRKNHTVSDVRPMRSGGLASAYLLAPH